LARRTSLRVINSRISLRYCQHFEIVLDTIKRYIISEGEVDDKSNSKQQLYIGFLQLMIVVVIDTFNFIQHKLQQLISLNRAQEMEKEVLDGLAEKSGEAYEKDS